MKYEKNQIDDVVTKAGGRGSRQQARASKRTAGKGGKGAPGTAQGKSSESRKEATAAHIFFCRLFLIRASLVTFSSVTSNTGGSGEKEGMAKYSKELE